MADFERKRPRLDDTVGGGVNLTEGPSVSWRDVPKTGIKIIDSDHKELVKLLNKLTLELEENRPPSTTTLTIDLINDYAKYHFDREERLMADYGYAGYHEHRERHLMFRRFFRAIQTVMREDPFYIDRSAVSAFLADWLVRHVGQSDMDYVRHIRDGDYDYADSGPDTGTSLNEADIAEALKDAQRILRNGGARALELRRALHEIRIKSALDISVEDAKKLLTQLRKRQRLPR